MPRRLQVLKGQRYRLNVIVSELRDATAVDYQTALVAFINCIIISTPQLKDRIRIRNEFIGECLLAQVLRLGYVCVHIMMIDVISVLQV
jgi:hypothetical protein